MFEGLANEAIRNQSEIDMTGAPRSEALGVARAYPSAQFSASPLAPAMKGGALTRVNVLRFGEASRAFESKRQNAISLPSGAVAPGVGGRVVGLATVTEGDGGGRGGGDGEPVTVMTRVVMALCP